MGKYYLPDKNLLNCHPLKIVCHTGKYNIALLSIIKNFVGYSSCFINMCRVCLDNDVHCQGFI